MDPIPSSPDTDRDGSRLVLPLHLVSGVLCSWYQRSTGDLQAERGAPRTFPLGTQADRVSHSEGQEVPTPCWDLTDFLRENLTFLRENLTFLR